MGNVLNMQGDYMPDEVITEAVPYSSDIAAMHTQVALDTISALREFAYTNKAAFLHMRIRNAGMAQAIRDMRHQLDRMELELGVKYRPYNK